MNTGACITTARNGAASAFKTAIASYGFAASIRVKVRRMGNNRYFITNIQQYLFATKMYNRPHKILGV